MEAESESWRDREWEKEWDHGSVARWECVLGLEMEPE